MRSQTHHGKDQQDLALPFVPRLLPDCVVLVMVTVVPGAVVVAVVVLVVTKGAGGGKVTVEVVALINCV